MKISRPVVFAAAIAVVVSAAVLAGLVFRDRGGTGTPTPTTSAPMAGTATPVAARTASATAAPSASLTQAGAGVLDDRFGFVIYDREARVRSETSDAAISSFTSKARSFTFLSHVVSPDGRSIAYWDPVDAGAVLRVRPVTGGSPRAVLTARPEMSGNAFTWSSDGTGLVAALDNNCFEICSGTSVTELWTVDLSNGATEKIASGSVWLPVTWDRASKLVAAGTTGPGGYLVSYDVIDLRQQPAAVRSTPYRPPSLGRLKASSDARYILLQNDQGGSTSLAWWPLAEPEKRSTVAFDGATAEWRPGTSEIWWVGGLVPAGCRVVPCSGSELISFDVATGVRGLAFRGTLGPSLIGFRSDGSAAIAASRGSTGAGGNVAALTFVEVATGRSATFDVIGLAADPVRLR